MKRDRDYLSSRADAQTPVLKNAIARCRSGFYAVGFFSALMNVLLLTGPFFMLQIYDRVLTSGSLSTLLALSLLAFALFLFYGSFDYVRSRLLSRLSQAFDRSLVNSAFEMTLAPRLNRSKAVIQDLKQVQQFVGSPAIATLFDVPWFPVYLFVIFLLHPYLGILALCGAIVLLVIAILNEFTSRKPLTLVHGLSGEEDKLASASLRQSETLTAMGMVGNVTQQWRGNHDQRLASQAKATDKQSAFASSSRTFRLILQSAILGFGAYLVIGNELSAGAMIAASIIFARALAPLDQSIAQWRTISGARSAYGRLKEGLSSASATQVETALELPRRQVTAKELHVAAPDKSAIVIENASFTLNAGDGLGVIGAAGAGKSALLMGLLDIWPATRGDVRLDGATLDQWTSEQRCRIIGYLPQDIELLPGTIAQNIARFGTDASSEAILEAAQLTNVHDLIVEKPRGYDTIIGQDGHVLSGGERQRIALARAVYERPFLVLLDEPNSNLDGAGEAALSETIKCLREAGSIVIVVTHRRAILSQLNKLLQIDAGRPIVFGDTERVLEHLREQQKQEATGNLRVVD